MEDHETEKAASSGRLRGNASAILGRRHVPAVPKSRDEKRADLLHGAEPNGERPANARVLRRALDDEGPDEGDKVVFRQLVFQ